MAAHKMEKNLSFPTKKERKLLKWSYEECILANSKLLNKQTFSGHINCNDMAQI